ELHVGYASVENWIASTGITDKSKIEYMRKISNDIVKIFKELGFEMEGENSKKSVAPKIIDKTEVKTVAPISTPVSTKKLSDEILELKSIILKMAKDIEEIKKKDSIENSKKNISKTQTIELGKGVVNIEIPKPPSVPSVIQVEGSKILDDRSIKFSKRVPPNNTKYGTKKDVKTDTSNKIGEVNRGRISAYLRGELMKEADAKKVLTDAGFTILASTPLDKKAKLISIVFTNKELTTLASKKNRGFAASLRLLINKKENQISITNPLYILKAFMQNEFDEKSAKEILASLVKNFKGLKNSDDALKFQLLPKYQFMNGLPFYEDMQVIASGDDLLEKIKNNKRVIFSQKLDNGAVLIGVKLAKRTTNFTRKIGTKNAAMLPYPVLIENGKAKMLDPKFYISIMYPKLQMSQFMTIASIPDAMVTDCSKVFK
ncbi:MAG: hypothetical protein KAU90_06880, partial [Sulfurovaceae bacterium]|nr:hypothetical protein [Sulfurovaceae bacterium]